MQVCLIESIEDLNKELGPRIAQRKIDVIKDKKKHLMKPKHIIMYGRSNHVQSINNIFENYQTS